MRIIAGLFKGRRLEGPSGPGVRPTSDGLRETLFNVIRERVAGARILDGFAGTGAVGLEALSRGAVHVLFVERDRRTVTMLEKNIAACRVEEVCEVIQDNFIGLSRRQPGLGAFDLVFVDPPYDLDDLDRVIVDAAAFLGAGGLLIVEHSRRRVVPESVAGVQRQRLLTAGDSALAFYTSAPAV